MWDSIRFKFTKNLQKKYLKRWYEEGKDMDFQQILQVLKTVSF